MNSVHFYGRKLLYKNFCIEVIWKVHSKLRCDTRNIIPCSELFNKIVITKALSIKKKEKDRGANEKVNLSIPNCFITQLDKNNNSDEFRIYI